MSYRVLVLDSDMVPALTIVRSLRARGCTVDAAGHREKSLTTYSRALHRHWIYPDPLLATDEFLVWLDGHTANHQYDLVIPVTERTVVPLSRNRHVINQSRVAIPESQSLELVLDKSKTLALATKVGVPAPMGLHIHTMDDLSRVSEGLIYPVVLKPARSLGAGEQGASQLQVSYAFDFTELRAGCSHALAYGSVLLQEFFPGVGVGIELIAHNGQIVYAFQHRRLHEVPLTGGGSSLRKSEPVRPELLAASSHLIEALAWNGVAMVEFKWNPDTRTFCLMEINGRFWGSLPLADAAGADFPAMLLELELLGGVESIEPYRENVYCRLLSRDLSWYEAVLRNDADPRITSVPPRGEIVKELGLLLSPKHYFDVQTLRDPLPGLIDLGRTLASYGVRLCSYINDKRFLRQQQRSWSKGRVAAAVKNAKSILFLCYGNINRSAVADVLFRPYAEDSGITVFSAGFHQQDQRLADPVMTEVAARSGASLEHFRSTALTDEMLTASDLIFVMEKSHHDRLVVERPEIADRIFLLGAHPSARQLPPEIADPYGQVRSEYDYCFERISEATDTLKSIIAVQTDE